MRPDVSIVICTRGRPERLAHLIGSIRAMESALNHEIVVVDNSGPLAATEPIPGVTWLCEPRIGLSFARNTGIRAATAPVVVFADDDMEAGPGWLDSLTRPVLTQGFDAVTGAALPMRLETEAERLFEAYGGHGYTGRKSVYGSGWLAAWKWRLPLWEVGVLGNAAIRKSVFESIGWFEEALGAGTPAGSWEDMDLIYRMLSAGHRILHDPEASVLHAHREDMESLARQLCAYRRGEVCFCLLAFWRYHDWRALTHLLLWVPAWRAALAIRECRRRFKGERIFPFSLMAREMLAYCSGPFALAASFRWKRIQNQIPNHR